MGDREQWTCKCTRTANATVWRDARMGKSVLTLLLFKDASPGQLATATPQSFAISPFVNDVAPCMRSSVVCGATLCTLRQLVL